MEIMSSEELKIRGELEMDVERGLEEEIKEGICRLAFRLHRLYQQGNTKNNKILSEVNINIKMDGGTKIEIKEIKKQPRENRFRTPKTDQSIVRGFMAAPPPPTKKFDWAKSLRSGPSSKIDCPNQSRILSNRAKTSASQQQQRQVNMGVNTKVLELDWKE